MKKNYETNTRLEDCIERWTNIISYISGVLLLLCSLFKAPKKLIVGLGVLFISSGNSMIKCYKIISYILSQMVGFIAWISVELEYAFR